MQPRLQARRQPPRVGTWYFAFQNFLYCILHAIKCLVFPPLDKIAELFSLFWQILWSIIFHTFKPFLSP